MGPVMDSNRKLLSKLCRELFQAETSARLHPRREADRLGDCPPAKALRAVSEDAELALATVPAPFSQRPSWRVGAFAGHAFSVARQAVIDRLVDRERSYRGTLFGLHHCVDLVTLLKATAVNGS